MQNELFQKIHEAIDLINRAKDIGCEVEVNIKIENGPEAARLRIRESVANDGTYYVEGYYVPEGRR